MKSLCILVAEDNVADVIVIREALQLHGISHELHVVEDGDLAISVFATMGKPEGMPCPDVMLLDLNLPKVDGPDILKEFRKHPTCLNTPVIVVSSSDTTKDREKVASMQVAHYFRKPPDLDEYMKIGQVILQVVGDKSHSASAGKYE